jgi:SAM-dependent methyltransferase
LRATRFGSYSLLENQIEAASAYEALFVPALFGQWAPKVAEAARIRAGQRVLDVACGTGVLARELAVRGARVAGIDPNPGMVAVARRITPAAEWHEGAAELLPFADASFDAVASPFGLMFFSDRPRALREMMRVLRPGGRLVVAVWDSLDHIPAYASLVALLERTAGRAAADALRAPFVLGERPGLGTLFAQAGIPSAAIATYRGSAQFPSIRTMVEADLRGWLPVMGVTLPEEQIARVLEEAETVLAAYRTAEGRARFPLSSHIVTAQKD